MVCTIPIITQTHVYNETTAIITVQSKDRWKDQDKEQESELNKKREKRLLNRGAEGRHITEVERVAGKVINSINSVYTRPDNATEK